MPVEKIAIKIHIILKEEAENIPKIFRPLTEFELTLTIYLKLKIKMTKIMTAVLILLNEIRFLTKYTNLDYKSNF